MSNDAGMTALFNPEFGLDYTPGDVQKMGHYFLIRSVVERCRSGLEPSFNHALMEALCQNARTCLDANRYTHDPESQSDRFRPVFDRDLKSRLRLFQVACDMLARIQPEIKEVPLDEMIATLASLYEG